MNLQLLTTADVAKFLMMSRETVLRLAGRGEIPGRKIGRVWRFPKDELEAYVREKDESATRLRNSEDKSHG